MNIEEIEKSLIDGDYEFVLMSRCFTVPGKFFVSISRKGATFQQGRADTLLEAYRKAFGGIAAGGSILNVAKPALSHQSEPASVADDLGDLLG